MDPTPFLDERNRIASWWGEMMFDPAGGFYGALDNSGEPDCGSVRCLILNARILWFFSALHCMRGDEEALRIARHGFAYLRTRFHDPQYGGFFWELDADGEPVDTSKKTYGQAFAIYALGAYYQACGDASALNLARESFQILQERTREPLAGGYVESFVRDWQAAGDMRLSERDLAAPLSMNNHLHVLEAFTQLVRVDRRQETEAALRDVLLLMSERFLGEGNSLVMFFDEQWRDCSTQYSYGHDIEASWLWWEAAEVLGDEDISARIRPQVMRLAGSVLQHAVTREGRVAEAADAATGELEQESIWWVQAESLVGFLNAWELSGESVYLELFRQVWGQVCRAHIDNDAGEWHWFADGERPLDPDVGYKAGPWKGPYHNGRAMMEVAARLSGHLVAA